MDIKEHLMSTSRRRFLRSSALAAAAAGADGLLIEVHNNPEGALCDGPQSLTPGAFKQLAESVFKILPYSEKFR